MYKDLIKKVRELGDQLPALAGNISDIGSKNTVVTDWDIKIETEIAELIKKFPGEHRIFAEELNDEYVHADNVWIMDPISNTFNFIHGLPHYSIAISHLHNSEVIFALVYDPSIKELFTAEKGKGAYLNDMKISVSSREDSLAALIGPHLNPKNAHRQKLVEVTDKLSQVATTRTFGSVAIHYAYVACGRADIAVTKNLDMFPEFAGKLLVEEAGGKFTDFSGKDITIHTGGVIATNGKVHEKIVNLIDPIFSK